MWKKLLGHVVYIMYGAVHKWHCFKSVQKKFYVCFDFEVNEISKLIWNFCFYDKNGLNSRTLSNKQLTHSICQIQPLFTRSKWNMGEILAFLVTLNFWPKNDDEKWSRKNIFEIPPCAHHVIFITAFWSKVQIQ